MPLCNEGAPHALPTGSRQATGNEEKNQKSGKDFEEDDECSFHISINFFIRWVLKIGFVGFSDDLRVQTVS